MVSNHQDSKINTPKYYYLFTKTDEVCIKILKYIKKFTYIYLIIQKSQKCTKNLNLNYF